MLYSKGDQYGKYNRERQGLGRGKETLPFTYPGYSIGKAVGDITKITSEKYPFPKRTMEAAGKAMDS